MAQEQWYMAIGGHQVGPVSQEDVVTNLRNGTIDGNTLKISHPSSEHQEKLIDAFIARHAASA